MPPFAWTSSPARRLIASARSTRPGKDSSSAWRAIWDLGDPVTPLMWFKSDETWCERSRVSRSRAGGTGTGGFWGWFAMRLIMAWILNHREASHGLSPPVRGGGADRQGRRPPRSRRGLSRRGGRSPSQYASPPGTGKGNGLAIAPAVDKAPPHRSSLWRAGKPVRALTTAPRP